MSGGLLRPDVVRAPGALDDRVPVTVLTGFLGAGKTTLLNRELETANGSRVLVVVNEFGDIGLDHALMVHAHEEGIIELSGGCVCCSLNGDLGRTLADAIWRFSREGRRDFDTVVIETTGLATPETVTGMLHRDFRVAAHYRLNGVVTVVDAVTVLKAKDEHEEVVRQVGGADRVVISKIDLVERRAIEAIRAWVTSVNPVAEVVDHPVTEPFDLAPTGWRTAPLTALPPFRRHDAMPAVSVEIPGRVETAAFGAWLDLLIVTAGPSLLRLKGIVHCTDGSSLVVHAVQGTAHPALVLEQPSAADGTTLVLIGHAVRAPAVSALLDAASILFRGKLRYNQ